MKMNSDSSTYWTQDRIRQKQMADQQKQALVNKYSKTKKEVEDIKSEVVQISKSFDLTEEQRQKVERAREILKSTKEDYFQQMDSYQQNIVQKTERKELSPWDHVLVQSSSIGSYHPLEVQQAIDSACVIASYKEEIPVKDIIPIFVDPMIFPKSTYIRTFIGGIPPGGFERNWLIVRTFDQFIETIENLFGKFDTPTRIPLALSLPFDLNVKKEFIVKKAILRDQIEEDPESYDNCQEEDNYNGSTTTGLRFYQGRSSQKTKSVPAKKLIAKKSNEKTGLDIANWLIENNYIPEAVNIHDRDYCLNYHNEISEKFAELFQKENLRDKVNCVDYV